MLLAAGTGCRGWLAALGLSAIVATGCAAFRETPLDVPPGHHSPGKAQTLGPRLRLMRVRSMHSHGVRVGLPARTQRHTEASVHRAITESPKGPTTRVSNEDARRKSW